MSTGLINLVTVGSATITVTHTPTGLTTTVPVTVTSVALDHLKLLLSNSAGTVGGTPPSLTVQKWADAAETTPSTSTVNLSYTMSNAAVATVNSTSGAITMVAAGSCTFTVTDSISGKTATSGTFTVSAAADTQPGLSGLQVLGDDYTGYANTSQFLSHVSTIAGGTGPTNSLYTDGRNATLASIDETVLYNGHHTLKYSIPESSAENPELWPTLPSLMSHVWFRARIRFTPGFTTHASGLTYNDQGQLVPSSDAYKLLGWGYDDGTNYGSGRIEITQTTQYQNYWGMNRKSDNVFSGGNVATHDDARAFCDNVVNEWTDGEWYTYIVEIDNTTPTGVTRFYIGKGIGTPVLRGTATGSMVSGGICTAMNSVLCGLNYNQYRNAGQSFSLNYGCWEVVDGNAHPNPFNL